MAITVTLNGQPREFTLVEPTIAALVSELGLQADRVALERNGSIVPRTLWAGVSVADGDRIELVHFVGGGAPVSL